MWMQHFLLSLDPRKGDIQNMNREAEQVVGPAPLGRSALQNYL